MLRSFKCSSRKDVLEVKLLKHLDSIGYKPVFQVKVEFLITRDLLDMIGFSIWTGGQRALNITESLQSSSPSNRRRTGQTSTPRHGTV